MARSLRASDEGTKARGELPEASHKTVLRAGPLFRCVASEALAVTLLAVTLLPAGRGPLRPARTGLSGCGPGPCVARGHPTHRSAGILDASGARSRAAAPESVFRRPADEGVAPGAAVCLGCR